MAKSKQDKEKEKKEKKERSFNTVLGALEKQKNIIAGKNKKKSISRIPSPLAYFNYYFGGLPKGRIIEVWGKEGSGKTTFTLMQISAFHEFLPKKKVVFVDFEHAVDPVYAGKLCDWDKVVWLQPEYTEQGFDAANELVETDEVSYLVFDSVAAMVPKAMYEMPTETDRMGIQAAKISQGVKNLLPKISIHNVVVIFINQTRIKMGGNPKYPEEITPGGDILKFYASIRFRMGKYEDKALEDTDEAKEYKIVGKAKKNKITGILPDWEWVVRSGKGILLENECLHLGVRAGIIKQGGQWYKIGKRKFQGKQSVLNFLKDEKVRQLIQKKAIELNEDEDE